MGTLSICFVVILIVYGPCFGRGRGPKNFQGPCQPFKADQSEICSELQAIVPDDGSETFCNVSRASCAVVNNFGGPSRKDYLWGYCYCDGLCKLIGDCCVDYDERNVTRYPAANTTAMLSCRRKPSHESRRTLGYVMVADCPALWSDRSTVEKCRSINYSADPVTALPVRDTKENVTYANIYCALCHGKTSGLQYWSLRIEVTLPGVGVSLQDLKSASTKWEAFPVKKSMEDKCLVTPSEAITGIDTKNKKLCRAYANGVGVKDGKGVFEPFKNPHCAMFLRQTSTINQTARCMKGAPQFPPRLPTVFFTFSKQAKASTKFRERTVLIESCPNNWIFDPFEGSCIQVHFSTPTNKTNITCQGPRFQHSEFLILVNESAFIKPHQKTYRSGSYILANDTLILCSNFSRRYNTTATPPGKNIPPGTGHVQSLILRIITYVGFSLSIISLLFLLVTYFLFAELRTYPGKMVMHLSCALIAMQSVYFASDPVVVSTAACAVMGAMLHYFVLAVFLWMSAIAYNMQKTFSSPSVNVNNHVVITKRKNSYIKYSLLSWGLPLVVVGTCVALQFTKTGDVIYGAEDNDGCQLSLPARTFAVSIPVSLSLLFNVYALVRTAVILKKFVQDNVPIRNQPNLRIILLKMTIVMGITWILGFALDFYPTPYLEYPFTIINSCQGLLICCSYLLKKDIFLKFRQKFGGNEIEPNTS